MKRKIQSKRNRWIKFSKELKLKKEYQTCAICNCSGKIDLHHLINRKSFKSLYLLDEKIIVPLCPKHHKFGFLSPHNNGIWFTEWLKLNRLEMYNYVLEISNKEII